MDVEYKDYILQIQVKEDLIPVFGPLNGNYLKAIAWLSQSNIWK